MINSLQKNKIYAKGFELNCDWVISNLIEGWKGVNFIRWYIGTRYKKSEVIKLPPLLTMRGHYLSRYVER